MEPIKLFFEEFGHADLPALLILHGFFASTRNWRQIAKKMADKHHIFVLDMRNHGSSPHSQQMDYPAMAADIKAFVEQHGLHSVTLLGHSMGGKVAMWFALNSPESVQQLIVVDIAPVNYRHGFDYIIDALKELPLENISNRKQAEAGLAASIPDLGFRQFMLQNLVLVDGKYHWRVDLDIFKRNSPAIVAFPDAGHLPPFSGTTLFLIGSDSQHVKPEYYPEIKMLFPASTLQILPDTGHWLHAEQPDQFITAVEGFLSTRPG